MLRFPLWKIVLLSLICVLGLLYAAPNFFPGLQGERRYIPGRTVHLGLDLRGGSYLLMQIDVPIALRDYLSEDRIAIAKTILRAGGQIVSNTYQVEQRKILIRVSESSPFSKLRRVLYGQYGAGYAISFKEDSHKISLTMSNRQYQKWLSNVIEQSREIIQRRVDDTGTKQVLIQRQGADKIAVEFPGITNVRNLKKLIGTTAKLTFHLVSSSTPQVASPKTSVLPGYEILPSRENPEVYWVVNKNVAVDGSELSSANATYSNGSPVVSFRFDNRGTPKFAGLTQQNVGRPIAIVLDGLVISAPVVRSPIVNGSGVIEGGFTPQGAHDLAILLRAGALPAPLKVVAQQVIGPQLGKDSIHDGIIAALIAFVLVGAFMLAIYGLFGAFAICSLFFNMIFLLALMTTIGATLTLAGIAGMVLTIGMSVDANVIIFENIRAELRAGRKMISSIEVGYRRALAIIMDSNLTTFFAALMLYLFGTGTIRGFSVTLTLGLISSVFSAIWLTRFWTFIWFRLRHPKRLSL